MQGLNERLVNDTEVVQWYIDVFEDGQDTRELVKLYAYLKKAHETLKVQFKVSVKELELKVAKSSKRLARVMCKLTT